MDPKHSYVPQNMTILGDMVFKEIIKLKMKVLVAVISNSLQCHGLYLTRLPGPMEFSRQEY